MILTATIVVLWVPEEELHSYNGAIGKNDPRLTARCPPKNIGLRETTALTPPGRCAAVCFAREPVKRIVAISCVRTNCAARKHSEVVGYG